jgi:hypothetical protein
MDAAAVEGFKSSLKVRLIATPITEHNQDEIVGDLLAVQS